tara:strand:+ start:735 stop:1241 length:507 start_codon:yes stop_codon:yes gene_type:complete
VGEKEMIDQETVKKLFYYDAESGMLLWRYGNKRNVKPWQEAKALNGNGYVCVKIQGKNYPVHRIIWVYVHGTFPEQDIDHKNRIRNDNRLCNLRVVSRTDNCQNISLPSHNKSGHIGVSWFKNHNCWTVYVKVNKKNKWLGYYKNLDDAIAARKAGEKQYYNLPEEVV